MSASPQTARVADHPVDPRFPARWSPRAFDGRPMTAEALSPLFEAARWAPSCMNSQPWRFVYALKGSADWAAFLDVLSPTNQIWVKDASALVFVCAQTLIGPPGATSGMPSPSYSFDAGAAWMQLALQAVELGMQTHAMAGFDRDRAAALLGVPETCRLEAAIAIGWPGDPAALPEPLQARETPSGRHPITSFTFAGRFPPTAEA